MAALGLVIGTIVLYTQFEIGLLPEMDEGGYVLDYRTPAGTSLDETNRIDPDDHTRDAIWPVAAGAGHRVRRGTTKTVGAGRDWRPSRFDLLTLLVMPALYRLLERARATE